MATKKTAVIPEEEILAAATEENINEHALHQTETEPEPDRVLSAEGAPGDADLIDICQTDSESANPEGMPIEDAARNTPEAPVSQTGSGTELPGEFPAGSDELTAPEAPVSQTDSDLEEKKPEESPPARRTRKPRAKKSESDTAAAELSGDASDGVEAPEKKPRRRAAARPASPVVSIDERPSVETEADKARNDLLDLVESLKTKRILTGTIQGIERPADHPSRSLAVIYHGDIKVIIPAEEAVEPPEDFRGRLPEDVLHYMVTKRLGAEVDYIIKGIDAKAGVAVGSRLEAMSAKRRAYYFGTDRDGNNLLYEGICAEARVVSVIRTGIFVDLFGLEVYIPLRELSYQRKGGCFSTYAYRLIWNEICTALIYANRRAAKECELIPEVLGKEDSLDEHHELSMILDRLEANASEAMAKGIRAIRLSAEGYSHAEIGSILGESDKCVAARISRTRKYLRSHPDLAAF